MRKSLISLVVASCVVLPLTGYASDDVYNMSIKNAMKLMPKDVKNQIGDFKFYFGKDSKPLTSSITGTIHTSNRTNGVFKSYQKSCNWVFYSALIDLEKQAKAMGGNGVANIESNWKNNPTSSKDTYVCGDGLIMSGVALKGDVIK
ncbi:excinuclease [Francisella sp. SYW-9]|uniref:excinuclease n=1 Tax=Francisella sp. SYW-9 TaxID=2610888 RepID=UPI00123DD62B|nr:excinuclease [Francisella sp. SYW-9]